MPKLLIYAIKWWDIYSQLWQTAEPFNITVSGAYRYNLTHDFMEFPSNMHVNSWEVPSKEITTSSTLLNKFNVKRTDWRNLRLNNLRDPYCVFRSAINDSGLRKFRKYWRSLKISGACNVITNVNETATFVRSNNVLFSYYAVILRVLRTVSINIVALKYGAMKSCRYLSSFRRNIKPPSLFLLPWRRRM